jgi:hypothetical protein
LFFIRLSAAKKPIATVNPTGKLQAAYQHKCIKSKVVDFKACVENDQATFIRF